MFLTSLVGSYGGVAASPPPTGAAKFLPSASFKPAVPNLFGTRCQLHRRQFFHRWGWSGDGLGMIQMHHIYCALHFCCYISSVTSSGVRSQRLGSPDLRNVVSVCGVRWSFHAQYLQFLWPQPSHCVTSGFQVPFYLGASGQLCSLASGGLELGSRSLGLVVGFWYLQAQCSGVGCWLWHGEGVGTLEPQVSPSPETARMVMAPLIKGDPSPGWTQPRDLHRCLEMGISSTPLTVRKWRLRALVSGIKLGLIDCGAQDLRTFLDHQLETHLRLGWGWCKLDSKPTMASQMKHQTQGEGNGGPERLPLGWL